jgi:hypothetical protein
MADSFVVEALDYQWGWLSYSEWQEAESVLPVLKEYGDVYRCMQAFMFE